MDKSTVIIPTNSYQTPITQEFLDSMPPEVQEQFMDFVSNVPLIKWMISPNRPYAKNLQRDKNGRIIVDITKPHILEDMDYFRPAAKFFMENGKYTLLKPNSNPNSEFGKWFIEEVRRCRDGYVRESDGEWVTGYMYWYLNYGKIMLNREDAESGIFNRVEEFPDFWEAIYYRYHYLDQSRKAHLHSMELARRGVSKAHPYDQVVYTPEGKKLWGDIKVGDLLFGDDGKTTRVIDIPFDDVSDIYSITLKDGRTIEASSDHLWDVCIHNRSDKVLSTLELREQYIRVRKVSYRNPNGVEYNIGIKKNAGVDWEEKPVPVDPYTFGLLLGDGCFRHPKAMNNAFYTCPESDFIEIQKYIPYEWKKLNTSNGCDYAIRIAGFGSVLQKYGLYMKKSEDKFIPDDYKFNSRHVRLELIKGIFDSDGFVSKGKASRISTSSRQLADDIVFVLRSLGINSDYTIQQAGYKKGDVYKQCLDSYSIGIHTDLIIAKLPRKQSTQNPSAYAHSRDNQTRIVSIEYVGRKRSKCVTVDNDSHCYLIGDFVKTHNSFSLASIMSHNLILGENLVATRRVTTVLTAYTKEYLSDKDGTFTKFTPFLDFLAENTEFPRLMVKRSPSEMIWTAGHKDRNGNTKGSLNSVMGLSVKDDEGKIRGKRGVILYEEMGNYPNFKEVWNNVRDSVKEGGRVFSQMIAVGTSGDEESDFAGIRTMMYHPDSFEIYSVKNVYDFDGKETAKFCLFSPAYLSRAGCMDKDGNSDVVRALKEILMERWVVKQSGDSSSLLSRIAQMPITPAEAILKVKSNFFPVQMINERLRQLDQDPRAFDGVYVGELVWIGERVEFRATNDIPIRDYTTSEDNTRQGALEIYEMPPNGEIPSNRYIIGHDPVDNDMAVSNSLPSTFVFDMYTDNIVAERTGRFPLADDNYDEVLKLCVFYNAKCMPEMNKKGIYSYFARKKALWRLADCPDYLRERGMIKYEAFGSSLKGISVNGPINNYAAGLIKDWLMKTYSVTVTEDNGETKTVNIQNVFRILCRALLQEMVAYGPTANTDRVSALGQVMLYREELLIKYGDSSDRNKVIEKDDSDDPFFDKDWEQHKAVLSHLGIR